MRGNDGRTNEHRDGRYEDEHGSLDGTALDARHGHECVGRAQLSPDAGPASAAGPPGDRRRHVRRRPVSGAALVGEAVEKRVSTSVIPLAPL